MLSQGPYKQKEANPQVANARLESIGIKVPIKYSYKNIVEAEAK